MAHPIAATAADGVTAKFGSRWAGEAEGPGECSSSSCSIDSPLPRVSPKVPSYDSVIKLSHCATCTWILPSPSGVTLPGGRTTPIPGDSPPGQKKNPRATDALAVDGSNSNTLSWRAKPSVAVPVSLPEEKSENRAVNGRNQSCSMNAHAPPSIPLPQRATMGLANSTPVTASTRFSPTPLRRMTGTSNGMMTSTAKKKTATAVGSPAAPQTAHTVTMQRLSLTGHWPPVSPLKLLSSTGGAGGVIAPAQTPTSSHALSPLVSALPAWPPAVETPAPSLGNTLHLQESLQMEPLTSTQTATPMEPSTPSSSPAEMPNWLAHLRTALQIFLSSTSAANETESAASDADVSNSFLPPHRTFSFRDALSEDDWINPCNGPNALEARTLLDKRSRCHSLLTCTGPHNPMGEDGEGCQPPIEDISHVTWRSNLMIEKSCRGTDAAVDRSSGDLLTPLSSNHWANLATSASTSPSMEISDSILIGGDWRARSPQSQRLQPDRWLSLHSTNPLDDEAAPNRRRSDAEGTTTSDSSISSRDTLSDASQSPTTLHGSDGSQHDHPIAVTASVVDSAAATTRALQSGEMNRFLGSPASPLRCAPTKNSMYDSAQSLLSNGDGPSAMDLPLARFLRNASSSSSGMKNAAVTPFHLPPMARLPRRSPAPQLRRQQVTRVTSHPSPTTTCHTGSGCCAPYVLSLALNAPSADPHQMGTHSTSRQDEAYPEVRPPSRPVSALTSSWETSLAQLDALTSGTTSGVSLATETQFVHYRA